MNLSVVIPAHNEAEVVEPTLRGLIDQLGPEGIDYEIVVVDDASSDGTGDVVASVSAEDPRVRCVRNEPPNGFGFAVRDGLEEFTGDAVVIVMADGSDDPRDVLLYYRVLEAGYDCAFGSRFMPGAVGARLPAPQARRSTASSTPASARSSGTATTTRRTRSRPTAARSSRTSGRCSRTTSTSPSSCR